LDSNKQHFFSNPSTLPQTNQQIKAFCSTYDDSIFGHGLCGQQHGLAMNWVDQPRTSADERDVVCSPRCRDCVWAVQGLVAFSIDLSFLREQST